jgi:VWFA-related protein
MLQWSTFREFFVKEIVLAAALALAVGGQQTASFPDAPQQQQAQKPQAQTPQSGIPDAPKPQTEGLVPVAPGIATTATSNGESGSASQAGSDAFQPDLDTTQQPKPPVDESKVQDTPPETPANSQDFIKENTLRIGVNTVEVPFTVKDNKGRLVAGLTWRDVHVYENNLRQKMTIFTVDPYPLSVAVVVDNSLPNDVMTRVNNALGALQGAFAPYDEVAVFTYNNGPKMITGFSGAGSPRVAAAIERSKSTGRDQIFYDTSGPMAHGIILNDGAESHENPLASGGPGSPQGLSQQTVPREVHTLNDAIMMAAQTVAKADKGRRRIVYVISDGKEYGSKWKKNDVIRYLQTNDIELEATLVGDSSVSGMGFVESIHLPLMMRDNILPVYTKATGGQFYADYRTKGIAASFLKLTDEARNQYTAWYNSSEPVLDGKYRKVEVRVLRPHLQVIAKEGYFPAARNAMPQNRASIPGNATTPPPQ